MTSETHITGCRWPESKKVALGERVRWGFAAPLGGGHVQAEVRPQADGSYEVPLAEALPHRGRIRNIAAELERSLNEEAHHGDRRN